MRTLLALSLCACAVDATPMFDGADASLEDSDAYVEQVDPTKDGAAPDRDASTGDSAILELDAAQEPDSAIPVDAGADSAFEVDAGTDAAVPPANTQCQSCWEDSDCINGYCTANVTIGVCLNSCTVTGDNCPRDNGLTCGSYIHNTYACSVNVNVYRGGCEEWLANQQ